MFRALTSRGENTPARLRPDGLTRKQVRALAEQLVAHLPYGNSTTKTQKKQLCQELVDSGRDLNQFKTGLYRCFQSTLYDSFDEVLEIIRALLRVPPEHLSKFMEVRSCYLNGARLVLGADISGMGRWNVRGSRYFDEVISKKALEKLSRLPHDVWLNRYEHLRHGDNEAHQIFFRFIHPELTRDMFSTASGEHGAASTSVPATQLLPPLPVMSASPARIVTTPNKPPKTPWETLRNKALSVEQLQAVQDATPQDNIPRHLTCPITQQLFVQPVMLPSGYSFELRALINIIKSDKTITCPLTRQIFPCEQIFYNQGIADGVQEWQETQKDPRRS